MTHPKDLDHLAGGIIAEDRPPTSHPKSPLQRFLTSDLPDITVSGFGESLQSFDDPRPGLGIQFPDVSEGARSE